MRVFRLGLIIGLGVGYVLGARAGKERYAQIRRLSSKLWRAEPTQQLTGQLREVANRAGHAIDDRAGGSFSKVAGMVRGGDGADSTPDTTLGTR